jgi:hypothetical protein
MGITPQGSGKGGNKYCMICAATFARMQFLAKDCYMCYVLCVPACTEHACLLLLGTWGEEWGWVEMKLFVSV